MNQLQNLSTLVGRLFLSAIFIQAGFGKIGAYEGTQAYMDAMGVPSMLLPLVIVFEILGGLAILSGFQTRIVAFLMVGFNLISALLFHFDFGDQIQSIMFMKNVAIAGGFLVLIGHGAGGYSVDNFMKKK